MRKFEEQLSKLQLQNKNANQYSGNPGNAEERCNKISPTQHKTSVSKFNIYSPKKRLLNKLNKHIPYILLKMESLFLLKETLLRLLVQNRPKRCIFFGTTKSKSPKIVSFKCKVLIYQFLCLCFGLGPAPRIITKLLKVPISLMRKLNVRLTIFLDDILLMAASVE